MNLSNANSLISNKNRLTNILVIDSFTKDLDPLLNRLRDHIKKIDVHQIQPSKLEAITTLDPDLVLINLGDLGAQGYKVCKLIRTCSALDDVPIVLVGNRESHHQSLMAFHHGSNDYFPLPLRVEECFARLRHHLDIHTVVRQLKTNNTKLQQKIQEQDWQLKQQKATQNVLVKCNQDLEKLAFVDALTQVTNRRGFDASLASLWSTAWQTQQPLSLIMCDVDFFKAYNDIYGHQAGDRCLKRLARIIDKTISSASAVIARYGGEEFAILLAASSTDYAQKIALKIRDEIAAISLPHRGTAPSYPFVSLSMGICTLVPQISMPASYLVRQADEALYAAKANGRNQIHVAVTADDSSLSHSQSSCLGPYGSILENELPSMVTNH